MKKVYLQGCLWQLLIIIVFHSIGVFSASAQVIGMKSNASETDSLKIKPVTNLNEFNLSIELNDFLEKKIPGVTLIRESGDPGHTGVVLSRGISVPFGFYSSGFENTPLYIINGIPLLGNEHPYVSQLSGNGNTGSGINISNFQDINNIESIKVLNSAEAFLKYGYRSENGVIDIRTKAPKAGSYNIELSSYMGLSAKNSAFYRNDFIVANGDYDRGLLYKYLGLYGESEINKLPDFLLDSTNAAYFGDATWADRYYRNAVQHGVSLNISGGNEMANFRFGVSERTTNGIVESASLGTYNSFFDIHIRPNEKLFLRTYVQAGLGNRIRSYSVRDRFETLNRLPSTFVPLPSNKNFLGKYYELLKGGIDDNRSTSLQVSLQGDYKITNNLDFKTEMNMDYNENIRELFIPSSIGEGSSYNSYFTGINRRLSTTNYLSYKAYSGRNSIVGVKLGQSIMSDRLKYDKINADRGPSDFIKIIGEGTTHNNELVYKSKDFLAHDMLSFFGNAEYFYKDLVKFSFGLRNDGSSHFGNGNKWRISPSSMFELTLFEQKKRHDKYFGLNLLKLELVASQSARFLPTDYQGYGPYYTSEVGYSQSSYLSVSTLSFPYSRGYVDGTMRMPYNNEFSAAIVINSFSSLNARLTYYRKESRDLVIDLPVDASYGFSHKKVNGMNIRNSGVELSLNQSHKFSNKISWTYGISAHYNKNQLISLPGQIQSLKYGNLYLEVGKAVDKFWLYENEGIYSEHQDIPVSSEGKKKNFKGIDFQPGDPIWVDQNNDFVINDEDRILKGKKIAPFKSNVFNSITYKRISFDFSIHISLGSSILNGGLSTRLNDLRASEGDYKDLKDISYWLVRKDFDNFPSYNPWSDVKSFRPEQDLFLESANYLKLESATVRYNLSDAFLFKKASLKNFQLFLTVENLFRLSPYKGLYPELTSVDGYDTGYKYPLPRTVLFGFKTSI